MDEERKKILQMVADGTITADDGARLLSALQNGKARERKEAKRKAKRRPKGKAVDMDALGEALSAIGPTVRDTVENVLSGFHGREGDPFDYMEDEVEDAREDLDPNRPVEVAEGAVIEFKSQGRDGGDLVAESHQGEKLVVSGDCRGLRVRGTPEHVRVSWAGGDLAAKVPDRVGALKVRTTAGDVLLKRIDAEVSTRTMGGDVGIEDLRGSFHSKLMGGYLTVGLAKGCRGSSGAKVMGGGVTLSIPPSVAVAVDAAAMGGEISVDESLGDCDIKTSKGMARATVLTGGSGDRANVSLKVAGGNVEVVSNEKD